VRPSAASVRLPVWPLRIRELFGLQPFFVSQRAGIHQAAAQDRCAHFPLMFVQPEGMPTDGTTGLLDMSGHWATTCPGAVIVPVAVTVRCRPSWIAPTVLESEWLADLLWMLVSWSMSWSFRVLPPVGVAGDSGDELSALAASRIAEHLRLQVTPYNYRDVLHDLLTSPERFQSVRDASTVSGSEPVVEALDDVFLTDPDTPGPSVKSPLSTAVARVRGLLPHVSERAAREALGRNGLSVDLAVAELLDLVDVADSLAAETPTSTNASGAGSANSPSASPGTAGAIACSGL
jgi:hypothetical protein